ncbi:acyl-CoA thioesterase [Haloferax namakaokahaiae]|uniref:Acyl-CoA thioesterase n=1 Tax=Haloferax namakaokahaiae TaxID=1748331 RepID=A0ABD5ZDQ2_9EURY
MRTIDKHPVRFGELAGPLVHGAMFFDWQLVSTQEFARGMEYSFEELVADGAIPYAPVGVDTTVYRYPTFGETVSVDVIVSNVGNSSLKLIYEMTDGDGEPLSTAQMTHVTIAPAGGALAHPADVKERLAERQTKRTVNVGPGEEPTGDESYPTFEESFSVNSPHIESSELAYFEEYPRFADIALESHLESEGVRLADLAGEYQPFRIRDWHWEFKSPVEFNSELTVECDVRAVDDETIRIDHTFRTAGETRIRGVSEYGCFDRTGIPTTFTAEMLTPFE